MEEVKEKKQYRKKELLQNEVNSLIKMGFTPKFLANADRGAVRFLMQSHNVKTVTINALMRRWGITDV